MSSDLNNISKFQLPYFNFKFLTSNFLTSNFFNFELLQLQMSSTQFSSTSNFFNFKLTLTSNLSGVACVWIIWSSSCSLLLPEKPHLLHLYIRGCLMLVPAGFIIPCTRSFNKFLALIHLIWVCSLPMFLQVINCTKCVVTHMTFEFGLFTVCIPAISSKLAISAADILAFYVLWMMFFLMLHQIF